MDVLSARTVIGLTEREVETLSRWLPAAVKRMHGAPGRPPAPKAVLDLASEISDAAVSSARFREFHPELEVSAPAEPAGCAAAAQASRSGAELTVREAAERVQVSESFMRRLARRKVVRADGGGRGSAWSIDAASLAAWDRQRRKGNDNRKAA